MAPTHQDNQEASTCASNKCRMRALAIARRLIETQPDRYTGGMSDNPSPHVINTTDADFERDVIERSKEVPVVVDFWATWCQPCRMLGPILENLADEYDGKFVLVKADGDHCPQATASFNVQAYPTVFGLRNGEPVDYFEGLPPEPQLREWIDRLMPSEADNLLAEAESLRASDINAAIGKLQQAVELAPHDVGTKTRLAEFLMEAERLEEAQQLLQQLHDVGYEGDVSQLLLAVQVKLQGQETGGVDACRAACDASPDDYSLKLDLAETLAADSQYAEALELALSAVVADKTTFGERGRTIMVGIFALLPDDSELITDYRRKLSSALF